MAYVYSVAQILSSSDRHYFFEGSAATSPASERLLIRTDDSSGLSQVVAVFSVDFNVGTVSLAQAAANALNGV